MDENLRRWILDQRAAGYTPEQIRASAAQSGWDPGVVDEALAMPPAPAPKKKGFNWNIVISIILVGLLLVALAYFSNLTGNLFRTTIPT